MVNGRFLVKIDLHTHSAFSDGRESVAEVFQCAAQAGLDVVALTDHDTTDGWQIAEVEAAKHRLSFVPGIELTTNHHDISVHLLAYLPSAEYEPLQIAMAEVRAARETRIERYVENLRAHPDYEKLTLESVLAEVREKGKSVGRPHIADALVARGIVPNRSAAFESILHFSGGYYLPHEAPTVLDGVRNDMRIAQEEIFGPVACLIPFDDEADAIRIGNGTPYGLVAGVWTKDGSRALRMAHALKCGQVFVNNYGAGGGIELPFGGVKASGHGREKGFEALYSFTTLKTVTIKHG